MSAHADRLERLRGKLAGADLSALLVTHLPNVAYMTGFAGSAARLVVRPDRLVFVTDGRYRNQAEAQLSGAGLDADLEIVTDWGAEKIAEATADTDRLGVEAMTLTLHYASVLEDAFGGVLVGTEGLVEGLRARKGPEEVETLARAVALADDALAEVLGGVDPDRATERDVALDLEVAMRRRGASGVSFAPIVASGANGALPHARPSDRVIGRGKPVVVDFGCVLDGYCSDTTRTVSWDGPGDEMARVHEVVRAAQDAARDAVRPGVGCRDVDATARDVIVDAGLGDLFVHATGHGVGLEVHEQPRLSARSGETLDVGNVVTIEPGVYVPGVGGVRIEDMVVVTETGCDTLTASPRALVR